MTAGIDLAKNELAVHCVDENGKAVLIKPKISRDQLLPLMAQLPACLIGMEACSGAHNWSRRFREDCHTVKRIAPKEVPLWDDQLIAQAIREDARSKHLMQDPGIDAEKP